MSLRIGISTGSKRLSSSSPCRPLPSWLARPMPPIARARPARTWLAADHDRGRGEDDARECADQHADGEREERVVGVRPHHERGDCAQAQGALLAEVQRAGALVEHLTRRRQGDAGARRKRRLRMSATRLTLHATILACRRRARTPEAGGDLTDGDAEEHQPVDRSHDVDRQPVGLQRDPGVEDRGDEDGAGDDADDRAAGERGDDESGQAVVVRDRRVQALRRPRQVEHARDAGDRAGEQHHDDDAPRHAHAGELGGALGCRRSCRSRSPTGCNGTRRTSRRPR